jgi:hypothetical protein
VSLPCGFAAHDTISARSGLSLAASQVSRSEKLLNA